MGVKYNVFYTLSDQLSGVIELYRFGGLDS